MGSICNIVTFRLHGHIPNEPVLFDEIRPVATITASIDAGKGLRRVSERLWPESDK